MNSLWVLFSDATTRWFDNQEDAIWYLRMAVSRWEHFKEAAPTLSAGPKPTLHVVKSSLVVDVR